MNYLNFNSRETYLVARQQWSVDYQATVKAIRQAKIGIKEAMRAGEPTWKARHALTTSHQAIQDLASVRYDMKQEAQRQYLAANPTS